MAAPKLCPPGFVCEVEGIRDNGTPRQGCVSSVPLCKVCPRQYVCPYEGIGGHPLPMAAPKLCPPGFVCEVEGIRDNGTPRQGCVSSDRSARSARASTCAPTRGSAA